MPIHHLENDGNVIRIFVNSDQESDSKSVTIADIRGGGADSQTIADAMAALLQTDLDVVVRRNTLPNDEPTRHTDPGLSHFFHRGGDIVARNVVVSIAWTGSEYVVKCTDNVDRSGSR